MPKQEFRERNITDLPTDLYQVANKKYADTGGPGSVLAYASVITVNPNKGRLFKFITTNAVSPATVNASVTGLFGQQLQILIENDSAGARTLVFAGNFRASSLVGLRSSVASISFVSDSNNFYETSRTAGL